MSYKNNGFISKCRSLVKGSLVFSRIYIAWNDYLFVHVFTREKKRPVMQYLQGSVTIREVLSNDR